MGLVPVSALMYKGQKEKKEEDKKGIQKKDHFNLNNMCELSDVMMVINKRELDKSRHELKLT